MNVGGSGVNLALPKINMVGRSSSLVYMTPKKPTYNSFSNYDPSPYSGGININYSSSTDIPLKGKSPSKSQLKPTTVNDYSNRELAFTEND